MRPPSHWYHRTAPRCAALATDLGLSICLEGGQCSVVTVVLLTVAILATPRLLPESAKSACRFVAGLFEAFGLSAAPAVSIAELGAPARQLWLQFARLGFPSGAQLAQLSQMHYFLFLARCYGLESGAMRQASEPGRGGRGWGRSCSWVSPLR